MTKKIKIIVANGKVLGYSEHMSIIKEFINDYGITDYYIEKIDKIPEEVEYEFSQKELSWDDYYGCVTSEYLLTYCALITGAVAGEMLEVNSALLNCLEYFKMENHEVDIVFATQQHLNALCADTIGIDDQSPEGYYSDYYEIKEFIREFIHLNIDVTGR